MGPNGFVIISIRDTGIGIPQDQLDKIFNRFYQVDGSHTRDQEGTGIGLSLTKELIELHKGKIEVESEESKGSIFKLTFPLGKNHLRPDEICEQEQDKDKDYDKDYEKDKEKDKGKEKTRTNAELEDFIVVKNENKIDIESAVKPALPTLLIADDNSDVRKYIRTILEKYYQIIEAKDGDEGWKNL